MELARKDEPRADGHIGRWDSGGRAMYVEELVHDLEGRMTRLYTLLVLCLSHEMSLGGSLRAIGRSKSHSNSCLCATDRLQCEPEQLEQ